MGGGVFEESDLFQGVGGESDCWGLRKVSDGRIFSLRDRESVG